MSVKFKIMIGICLLSLAMTGTFGLFAQDDDVTEDTPEYTLMFTSSDQRYTGDIYALNHETGEPIALITEAFARYPVWSSTNEELAFLAVLPTGDDIVIFNVETQDITNLTQNRAYESFPRWSPDGEKIAFATDLTGDWEVFVINRDGSDLINLSNTPDAYDGGGGLDWSPDGSKIVFVSDRNGRSGIYVMNADGSDQHLLLSNDPPSLDISPVWSSANQIAFVSDRPQGYGIYLVNDDGSNLSHLPIPLDFPQYGRYGLMAWAPDNIFLAYTVDTGTVRSSDFYMTEPANDSDPIRLTDNNIYDNYPAWIPVSIVESDVFPVSLNDLSFSDD